MEQGELAGIVGPRVRALREQYGVTADALARAARSVGLPWSRLTVYGIEQQGARPRRLSIEELALLPWLLHQAGAPAPVRVIENNDRIDLAPGVRGVSGSVLFAMLSAPESGPFVLLEDDDDDVLSLDAEELFPELTPEQVRAAHRAARGAAEARAAASLRVSPRLVSLASLATWGRPLSEERDARLSEEDLAGRDRHRAAGHVTRRLVKELRGVLAQKGIEDVISRGDETPER